MAAKKASKKQRGHVKIYKDKEMPHDIYVLERTKVL